MLLGAWTALLVGAILTGLALVGVMALSSPRDIAAGVGGLLVLLASLGGVVAIAILTTGVLETIAACGLAVAAFAGGFALGAALLAQMAPDPPVPQLPEETVDGEGGLGVVLLADAEPEKYEPGAISRELRTLDEAGVELPPEPARVFVYASEKARFRVAGGSIARDTVRALATRLRDRLAEDRRSVQVVTAWADDRPLADEAVAALVRGGVRDIVVAELGAGAGLTVALRRLDALRPATRGIRLTTVDGLWASSLLVDHLAERVMKAIGDVAPEDCGVALLGYGRPEELSRLAHDAEEHELLFQQRLRALLVERGFDAARVRLAWVEWQEPGVTEAVRHLAALGCTRIVVLPATLPVATVSSTLDIRDAVEQARVEKVAKVALLPPWGEDQAVVEALARLVDGAAAELTQER